MKCYVLMIAKNFPKSHSMRGNETGFMMSIKGYDKIHTIRQNYEFWQKRFEKINKGEAYISVRQWSGKPYASKQEEIFRYDHRHKIGLEKIEFNGCGWMCIGNRIIDTTEIANNDGLSKMDFIDWFAGVDIKKPLALIHFTDFRYQPVLQNV